MARRIHVPRVYPGDLPLDNAQAHHARDVLRLAHGMEVEVFDDAGTIACGLLLWDDPSPRVRVTSVEPPPAADATVRLTVAAAVPKGDRADWMVEKLSELGVEALIPLAAARSVVLPEGKGKRDRWARIATEAAKQSRRRGVMRIEDLTPLDRCLRAAASTGPAWCLSTAAGVRPVTAALAELPPVAALIAFVGPEGGWTDVELTRFAAAGVVSVALTPTVLRVETAAVAVAAIVGAVAGRKADICQGESPRVPSGERSQAPHRGR